MKPRSRTGHMGATKEEFWKAIDEVHREHWGKTDEISYFISNHFMNGLLYEDFQIIGSRNWTG